MSLQHKEGFMAGKDIIIMTPKELKRLYTIQRVLDKKLKQVEAAELLDLSSRQVGRITKRVKQEGDRGVIHKGRGIISHRAIPEKVKDKALGLCKGRYDGFNPTFAAEKLFEIDKIRISRETLRCWFKEEGIPYKRRKGRPHRSWRERKHHFGEMIQIDGSHHDWLEGRGPECVLMGYIDDATNNVFARFYDYEGTLPAMDSFMRYAKKYGLPFSIYVDKHSTYKSTAKPKLEDELNNAHPQSHFGRAVSELGVKVIYAYSCQAKGRVERLFETFQDRLIKEMRLKGVSTTAGANKFLEHYLPVFNRRFGVLALEKEDFHRQLPQGIDLDKVLSIKTEHLLRNDFTVMHDNKLYQVLDSANTRKVTVEEKANGRMFITYRGRQLKYKEITQRPVKKEKPALPQLRQHYIPPADHPWRSFKLPGSVNLEAREESLAGAL